MKASDIFNRKNPGPLDRHLYPVYKDFIVLQQELIRNWIQDVVSGKLMYRDYLDLKDVRLDVKSTGEPVISLKPFVGIEAQEKLGLYLAFFAVYKSYTKALNEIIALGIMNKMFDHPDTQKEWTKTNKRTIHMLAVILNVMVKGMVDGNLTLNHITILNETVNEDPSKVIPSINALVRDLQLDHTLSDAFMLGNADFFHHPDPELVGSFWKYGAKKMLHVTESEPKTSEVNPA